MADYAPWPVSCATPRDIGQSGLPEPAEDPAQPFGLECAIRCADAALTELSGKVLLAEDMVPVATHEFLAGQGVTAPTALMNAPPILQNGYHGLLARLV